MGLAKVLLLCIVGIASLTFAYFIGIGVGYRAAEKDHQEHMRAVFDREHAEVAAQP